MRCLGILDDQAKGAWSSLWAVAGEDFERGESGGYVVPYARMGVPSKNALDGEMAGRLWGFFESDGIGRGGGGW